MVLSISSSIVIHTAAQGFFQIELPALDTLWHTDLRDWKGRKTYGYPGYRHLPVTAIDVLILPPNKRQITKPLKLARGIQADW
ncbi:Dna Primase Large Subunit [Manis pentadactyla]|nr:Dna Primase Large Subunit [Manis pentadactyla]